MPTDLERLVLLVEANTKSLDRQMKKMERNIDSTFKRSAKSTKHFNKALTATQRQLATFGKVFAGAFAVTATAQVPGLIREVVSEASNLGKIADKVGLATGALQELRFAAELSGVGASQLDVAMQRFSRRLAEAANGTGELLNILKANGVALRNNDGSMRSQNDLLQDYAELIKNAGSEQERLLLAFKAFDTEGAALVNMLRDGSSGLRELRQEAHNAGGVIRDDLIREMESVDDEFAKLARTIGHSLKNAILEVVSAFSSLEEEIPKIDDLLTRFQGKQSQLSKELGLARVMQDASQIQALEAELDVVEQRIAGIAGYSREHKQGLNKGPSGRGGRRRTDETTTTVIPDPEDGKAAQKLANAASKKRDAIDSVIVSLEREAMALSMSAEAQRLNNALSEAGVSINSKAGQEIAHRVEQINKLVAAQEQSKEQQQQFNELMSLTENATMSVFDSLIDGTEDMGKAFENLAKDMAKMAVQAALFGSGPMSGLFGTQSSGGLLGSLGAAVFHDGGIAGGPAPTRSVSPAMFANAPRYHNGGIAGLKPDEVPAILQRGERVIPNGLRTPTPNLNPPMPSLASTAVSVDVTLGVSIDKKGTIKPYVESVSQQIAGRTVAAAAPKIIESAVSDSGSALASGKFDGPMGRFNASPKALVG